MRQVFGAIVVALGMAAASPAFAGEGAAPAGAAPLLTVAASAAPVVTLPAEVSDAAFRLAPLTSVSPEAKSATVTTDLVGGLHHRFTGNMMEYYPFAGFGFHLSGGTRLFQRRNLLTEAGDSARGALAMTRLTTPSAVTRAGFRRFNPVATAGYTLPLSSMMQIGVEAGAMMTRAFAGTPGLLRHTTAFRGENGFHPNAIANIVFGMHF